MAKTRENEERINRLKGIVDNMPELPGSYQFWNGDRIYVNLNWRQDGYAIAYQNGVYGYVDANYINW